MSRAVGTSFEQLAADFLAQQGFTILDANYTVRGGEIDLVCDHRGTLVFVEVRARHDDLHGAPEETISEVKRGRIVQAARHYLLSHGIDESERACRFDVVAVEGDTITHYADAFSAPGNF